MLIDQTEMQKNIVPAQITKVFYPFVIAKTEYGTSIYLNLSRKEKDDPLFWESMHRVSSAALWIPVGKNYHQMLDHGWIAD